MMEIQPEAKSIYLIDLDTSAQYDRKRKLPGVVAALSESIWKSARMN